jgi:hypothetical protein
MKGHYTKQNHFFFFFVQSLISGLSHFKIGGSLIWEGQQMGGHYIRMNTAFYIQAPRTSVMIIAIIFKVATNC